MSSIILSSYFRTTFCFRTTKMTTQGALLLAKQLKGLWLELTKRPIEGFSAGLVDDSDMFKWQVCMSGPGETPYEATMDFPPDYPINPPKMRFVSEMWHPNIYPNGDVCISILHPPGDDEYGYESSSERWRPVNTVESIVVSVQSMLSCPNIDSPANIEAAKQFRDDYPAFRKRVLKTVRKSQEQ